MPNRLAARGNLRFNEWMELTGARNEWMERSQRPALTSSAPVSRTRSVSVAEVLRRRWVSRAQAT
jgi:hypothetical protein